MASRRMVVRTAAPSQKRHAVHSPSIGGTVPPVPGSGSRKISWLKRPTGVVLAVGKEVQDRGLVLVTQSKLDPVKAPIDLLTLPELQDVHRVGEPAVAGYFEIGLRIGIGMCASRPRLIALLSAWARNTGSFASISCFATKVILRETEDAERWPSAPTRTPTTATSEIVRLSSGRTKRTVQYAHNWSTNGSPVVCWGRVRRAADSVGSPHSRENRVGPATRT